MKIGMVTAALLGAMVISNGAAIAAPKSVEDSVTRVMQSSGIQGTAKNATILESSTGEDGIVTKYTAWVEIPGPAPGYLVIDTSPKGAVKQVYTRFGGRIHEATAY